MNQSNQEWCYACGCVTEHDEHGHCVECRAEEVHDEAIRWMRTKRKCLSILTGVAGVAIVNWGLAHRYDGDDMARTGLQGIVVALVVWVSSSLRKEKQLREQKE